MGEGKQDREEQQKNARTGAQNKFHVQTNLFPTILLTEPFWDSFEAEWYGLLTAECL